MKRFIALAVVFIMIFSLSACGGDERGSVSSETVVDTKTIDTVKNAYNTTEELLKSVNALGVETSIVMTTTVNEESLSERTTSNLVFVNTDSGKQYSIGSVVKIGDITDEMQIYCDSKDIYGARAGKTYILSKNKDTDAYVDAVLGSVKIGSLPTTNVLKTVIVNTDTGGYGFVLDYECEKATAEKLFGTYFTEAAEGHDITFTKLSVRGIIDSKGRITEQRIELEYTYEVKETASEVSSSTESGTSSNSKNISSESKTGSQADSSVAAETVAKKVTAKLTANNIFNYDVDTVKVPDLVVIGKDEDGNDIKHDEISISDFTDLAAGSSDKEDKDNKK